MAKEQKKNCKNLSKKRAILLNCFLNDAHCASRQMKVRGEKSQKHINGFSADTSLLVEKN
jgi:hypothetical protein